MSNDINQYLSIRRLINETNCRNEQIAELVKEIQTNNAVDISKNLYDKIIEFQEKISPTQDVILLLVSFGQSYTMAVDGIGHSGNNLVCFHGTDNSGTEQVLIQHISQLNFLITSQPKEIPEAPKRTIGFLGEVD